MQHLRRFVLTAVAVTALTLASAATARAHIVVMTSVNNQGTDNVLLTDATGVPIVMGTVNNGLFGVNFDSSGGLLNADASGQAVITPGMGNDPFTSIRFYLDDNATFTRAVFNINSATTGQAQLLVTGIDLETGQTFMEVVSVDANGENFFTVDAINGQLMLSIEILALGDVEFQDLRQVRIGGVAPAQQPVPEPVTLLLLGTGLAGIAAQVRRQRHSHQGD